MTFCKRIPQDTGNLKEVAWLPMDGAQDHYSPTLIFDSKAKYWTSEQSGQLRWLFELMPSSETNSIKKCSFHGNESKTRCYRETVHSCELQELHCE